MKLLRSFVPVLLAALFIGALSYSNAISQTVIGTNIRLNVRTATSYTFLCSPPDAGKLVIFNNASSIAVTLPQSGTRCFVKGWYAYVASVGAGTATITPTTSTVGGAATLAVATGTTYLLISDGTNYEVVR